MQANFGSAVVFTVSGDRSAEFAAGVRVLADCGADGTRYGTVAAAAYAADTGLTLVTVSPDGAGLTANLTGVLHGNDVPASLANHGHTGQADGGAVAHGALSGAGTNSHAVLDAFLASKGAASGLAALDAASLVVQNPANAAATPGAGKIPIASALGKLSAWIDAATTGIAGIVKLATTTMCQAGTDMSTAVTPAGLAASAKGLISSNTTIYVATTGNDSTGDGSSGAPYASIAQALYSIRNKLIASGVTVTIQVADGTYTIASTITVDHPDGDKIQILGNTTAETTVAITTIDVSEKTFSISGDYTATVLPGEYIDVIGSSTSELNGTYLVSARSYSGGYTVIVCADETLASSDVGGGSVRVKPCNRCRLVFGGVNGIAVLSNLGWLSGFVLDGVVETDYAIVMYGIKQSVGGNLVLANWGTGILCQSNVLLSLNGASIKNCVVGINCFMSKMQIVPWGGDYLILDSISFSGEYAQRGSFLSQLSTNTIFRQCTTPLTPAANTLGNYNAYIMYM